MRESSTSFGGEGRGGEVGGVGEGEGDGEEEREIRPDFVNGGDGEEEEEVDEGEMRRVVMGRVGGWVDWAVGWMDFRGEGEGEDEDGDGDGEVGKRGELDAGELKRRLRGKKGGDEEVESAGGSGSEGTGSVGAAPEIASVWGDAKWLLGVARKAAV